MIRVFVGYDPREAVAANVLAYSIVRRSSVPVSVTFLLRNQLPVGEPDAKASTEFADTRFLVPWLCDFQDWAVFMDCDQLMLGDIKNLWSLKNGNCDLMVVKHDHQPKRSTKFLGAQQFSYDRKNWSSLMLMNCGKLTHMTPDWVRSTPGLQQQQFIGIADSRIGSLPDTYNVLIGNQTYPTKPEHVHYTDGGPYFHQYEHCDYSDEWYGELDRMLAVQQAVRTR